MAQYWLAGFERNFWMAVRDLLRHPLSLPGEFLNESSEGKDGTKELQRERRDLVEPILKIKQLGEEEGSMSGMMTMPRPGGTINDLNVVLQHDTKLPLRLNNRSTCVWREPKDGDRADHTRWVKIKDVGIVLPDDSPELDFPTTTLATIAALAEEQTGDPFEHADIISLDESDSD